MANEKIWTSTSELFILFITHPSYTKMKTLVITSENVL